MNTEDFIRGHSCLIPPRIGGLFERSSDALLDHFRKSSSSDVADAVGRLYTMDSRMRPLYSPMKRAVGIALTVKALPGDNLSIHAALGMVQQNDFLVVDWCGYGEGAGSGVNSLIDPIARGLVGIAVDGAWRDVQEIQSLDFPIFGRGIAPFSPAKGLLGEINVPVSCGGVIVEAGDIVVADEGGIAVVPLRHAKEVSKAVEPYTVRRTMGDYSVDALRQAADSRRKIIRQLFTQQHGLGLQDVL